MSGLFDDLESSFARAPRQRATVATLPAPARLLPAPEPLPVAEDASVWTWAQPDRRAPDSLHARFDRGELVLIIRGSANGSIGTGQGGVRLPAEAAAALTRFLAERGAPPHA